MSRKSISHPFAYHGLPYMSQPVFTVWQKHMREGEAPTSSKADQAIDEHPNPSLRDMHRVIHAKRLGDRFDGAGGWSPAWSQPIATSPSRPRPTTSVSFGTVGYQPSPPSRQVFATSPRTQAPFGIPGPSASPSSNNRSLPQEASSSPSVTQPWAALPRSMSPASRGKSGSVKGRARGRRTHSRWDQTTPREVGPN